MTTKNMRGRLKLAVGTKQIKDEDGKMVKPSQILESIMDDWNVITNSSINELYVEFVIQFKKVCAKYPNFQQYVEITILDKMKEKIGSA